MTGSKAINHEKHERHENKNAGELMCWLILKGLRQAFSVSSLFLKGEGMFQFESHAHPPHVKNEAWVWLPRRSRSVNSVVGILGCSEGVTQ